MLCLTPKINKSKIKKIILKIYSISIKKAVSIYKLTESQVKVKIGTEYIENQFFYMFVL